MCGLTGFWDPRHTLSEPEACLAAMNAKLAHRGPDDDQVHYEAETGVGLGHRRLAILDLSPEGRQPKASASGRYVLVFNGEIYNYQDLARELVAAGAVFRGTGDTEVLLAALDFWGLAAAVPRLNGMFAMAVWDRQEHVLHLVRDRLGIKPLYYGHAGETLVFASDPAAFTAVPGFDRKIDRGALTLYLRHMYVPAPWCIYEGVRKLAAGHVLSLPAGVGRELPTPEPYWSAATVVRAGQDQPFNGSPEAAVEELDTLLRDAVSRRMMSDVPLGAFVSGGVDSSLVVGLMQSATARPVRTFSIGFTEKQFDESAFAAEVARHLGTEHTRLVVSPRDCLDVVPQLPTMYSEPFADSSQVPTFLVSQLARRSVTVSLSGDGGDELFCGYHRYNFAHHLERIDRRSPAWLRGALAPGLRAVPVGVWDRVLKMLKPVNSDGRDFALTGDRMHKLAGVVGQRDFAGMYRALLSLWSDPERLVSGGQEPATAFATANPARGVMAKAMYRDLTNYLPDDILTKVDRASMAVGLEARVPLLDHRVVEWAWRLPQAYKVQDGQGKWVLRRVLDRYVPRALIDRPKRGFAVPLATWLRGPLREWGESLLTKELLEDKGLLAARRVRRLWDQFQGGERQWQSQLWTILMFQAWLQEWDAK